MTKAVTQEELFQEVLATTYTGEDTIEGLRAKCVAGHVFDDDPGLRRAREKYMDRKIRDWARQGGWVDKEGEPLELVSVVRKEESGKASRFYVDTRLATFEDHVYLVKDRLTKSEYFRSESRRFYDEGVAKFGRKFQRLFQFD